QPHPRYLTSFPTRRSSDLKGSATDFTEEEWFITLKKALAMDDLISKHAEIMERYDPEKRVGMIVDEWGTWHDVEPGTNPHFLYQDRKSTRLNSSHVAISYA